MSVANRPSTLKTAGYQTPDIKAFDKFDLWQELLVEVREKGVSDVSFLKVKAHVGSNYTGQPKWMTEGNTLVDSLAKGQGYCAAGVF